ncbi:hypothetical protein [Cereibacter sphaeroides]|jgi:DNA-directed RNA polymerase subunit RPC12/RpoP|uniref:hypothetical protein n=1 Tax=Cereibacter sphaeroides TaxID=1063 RepID=UPI000323B803
MAEPSAEHLARWKASKEEERNRRCPHCGGKTSFIHVMFDRKKRPDLLPSMWVHVCGKCSFMAYLTGDREIDVQARNLLNDGRGGRAE